MPRASFLTRVVAALVMLVSCSLLVHFHMAASVSSQTARPPRSLGARGAPTARELKAQLAIRQQLRDEAELSDGPRNGHRRFDVTLVSQASEERLWMVRPLSKRWGGPVSIAIFMEDLQLRARVEALVEQARRQPNGTITTVDGANASEYPINALRNMAVAHVTTSHFFLTDIDLWPSVDAYRRVLALGPAYLRRPRTAVLFPAFEYTLGGLLKRGVSSDDHQYLAASVPASFEQLRTCVSNQARAAATRRFRAPRAPQQCTFSIAGRARQPLPHVQGVDGHARHDRLRQVVGGDGAVHAAVLPLDALRAVPRGAAPQRHARIRRALRRLRCAAPARAPAPRSQRNGKPLDVEPPTTAR